LFFSPRNLKKIFVNQRFMSIWWWGKARWMAVLPAGTFGLEWTPLSDNFATKNEGATCLSTEALQQQ
jgi:hypothetical protein